MTSSWRQRQVLSSSRGRSGLLDRQKPNSPSCQNVSPMSSLNHLMLPRQQLIRDWLTVFPWHSAVRSVLLCSRITWELSFAEAKTQNPDQVCGECYVCPAIFVGVKGREAFIRSPLGGSNILFAQARHMLKIASFCPWDLIGQSARIGDTKFMSILLYPTARHVGKKNAFIMMTKARHKMDLPAMGLVQLPLWATGRHLVSSWVFSQHRYLVRTFVRFCLHR